MVLKEAKVYKSVSIQHCHNFLYMIHLWKIAYDVIIVSIKMLKCYIGFYLNCATAWDARVNLKESKPKTLNHYKDKVHDRLAWICHFCGNSGHIYPNCFKLQAAKRANKPKVPVPQAHPMVLIGELIKALNLYSNPWVA